MWLSILQVHLLIEFFPCKKNASETFYSLHLRINIFMPFGWQRKRKKAHTNTPYNVRMRLERKKSCIKIGEQRSEGIRLEAKKHKKSEIGICRVESSVSMSIYFHLFRSFHFDSFVSTCSFYYSIYLTPSNATKK